MIKVTIKCFSQVKYAFGKDELNLELETGTSTLELENIIHSPIFVEGTSRSD